MVKVCCFDLDGTLLPMDMEAFVRHYLEELAPHVAHLLSPDRLVSLIWDATKAMIENDNPDSTNEEVFQRRFLSQSGLKREEIWPLFERFYREHFPKLKAYVQPTPLSRQVVEAALERGYRVIVATNPVFPRDAIWERIRWGRVEDLIDWATVYEETHYCKPNPKYYQEIIHRLGVQPEECVMIGNDMQEDMVAKTVGMKTYFLKDCRIDRGDPAYRPDQEGSLSELLEDIRCGQGVFSRKVG
ncbi:HAD family hydrolase [Paludifilum halophilum]|uniref:Haloacid dehalogenase n=1 Tax=Paludifilum halophilum TaxID=1642702 RepID=A0A235B9D4_9BACL|nr:HAD family hydrolase [Paludifilum halophilum]OYD08497.1 haloacid dehalogenase [Paludifilum halophilum]